MAAIADDNQLAATVHAMKSAPLDFGQKGCAFNLAFNAFNRTAHHATPAGGPCIKHVVKPAMEGRVMGMGDGSVRVYAISLFTRWLTYT